MKQFEHVNFILEVCGFTMCVFPARYFGGITIVCGPCENSAFEIASNETAADIVYEYNQKFFEANPQFPQASGGNLFEALSNLDNKIKELDLQTEEHRKQWESAVYDMTALYNEDYQAFFLKDSNE